MSIETKNNTNMMIAFRASLDQYVLPKRFTFPFYYEPDPLCRLAVKELQDYLSRQQDWEHNFGLIADKKGPVIGKMFGVLIVQKQNGDIGYLAAFSGKLTGENNTSAFVSSLFNIDAADGFLTKGMMVLKEMGVQISTFEERTDFNDCKKFVAKEQELFEKEIKAQKQLMKDGKKARKMRREQAKLELSPENFNALEESLIKESQGGNIRLTHLKRDWKVRLTKAQEELNLFYHELSLLKEARKNKSIALQQKLFEQYQFLNQKGERKNLSEIFKEFEPPSGAGECAAPKLLQYACLLYTSDAADE